jgi:two-component sensor histidine kinase
MVDATTDLGLAFEQRSARRRIAIIGSLLLILAAAGAALLLVQGIDRQLQDVVRTYEVRKLARELIMGLMEAESAQRGYLLTLDDQYLAPFQSALDDVDARMDGLLAITSDSPSQRSRIAGLAEEITQKEAEMSATIGLVAAGRIEQAQEVTRSNIGLRLMDDVRTVVDAFVAQEDELLVQRNADVERTRQWVVISILGALAGSASLAYALFNRSQSQMSQLAQSRSALASANEELEAAVRVRTAELEEARSHSERERQRVEALLQESNHRIGNSLATVSSLIALQIMRMRSDEAKGALEAARDRVHTIAAGHRRLRLGDDLETTQVDEFLAAVIEDFASAQGADNRITFETAFDSIVIPARDATTVGILLGELVTNAQKHAFPDGRRGRIWSTLRNNGNGDVTLSVADDGVGMSGEVGAKESGLGSLIIRQLAQQFGGVPDYGPREGGGTTVSVPLPKLADKVSRSLAEPLPS